MATLRFLLKRFVAQRLLGLAIVVTLAFTIGVLVAGPIYADAAREAILVSGGPSANVTVAQRAVPRSTATATFPWADADASITEATSVAPRGDSLVPQGR